MTSPQNQIQHPLDDLLRTDRIPHIWCPGCGIGTAFAACLTAMKISGIDLKKTVMVSGIGCSARGAGYVMLDSLPHHPWPGHPLCHGAEAGQSRTERGGFQRRRRPLRHRGESFHSRRAPKRGYHRGLRKQSQLRHDRRAGGRPPRRWAPRPPPHRPATRTVPLIFR